MVEQLFVFFEMRTQNIPRIAIVHISLILFGRLRHMYRAAVEAVAL